MIDIYDTYEPDDVLLDSSWDDIGDIGTLVGQEVKNESKRTKR